MPVRAGAMYASIRISESREISNLWFTEEDDGIGWFGRIAKLHNHSNNCAFGHVEGATMFHDGSTKGPANFAGRIAEFYQYNEILSSNDRQTLEDFLISKYGSSE